VCGFRTVTVAVDCTGLCHEHFVFLPVNIIEEYAVPCELTVYIGVTTTQIIRTSLYTNASIIPGLCGHAYLHICYIVLSILTHIRKIYVFQEHLLAHCTMRNPQSTMFSITKINIQLNVHVQNQCNDVQSCCHSWHMFKWQAMFVICR